MGWRERRGWDGLAGVWRELGLGMGGFGIWLGGFGYFIIKGRRVKERKIGE